MAQDWHAHCLHTVDTTVLHQAIEIMVKQLPKGASFHDCLTKLHFLFTIFKALLQDCGILIAKALEIQHSCPYKKNDA